VSKPCHVLRWRLGLRLSSSWMRHRFQIGPGNLNLELYPRTPAELPQLRACVLHVCYCLTYYGIMSAGGPQVSDEPACASQCRRHAEDRHRTSDAQAHPTLSLVWRDLVKPSPRGGRLASIGLVGAVSRSSRFPPSYVVNSDRGAELGIGWLSGRRGG